MSETDLPVALITGASRGLGAALAEALAPKHHVIAVARTVGGLEELDDRIKAKGGAATLAPLDVTDADAMAHMAGSIAGRWGGCALWCHTAIHAAPLTPADQIQPRDWEKSVAVNIEATRVLIAQVAPLLQSASGHAVFFDDPRAGEKFFGSYGATKAAQMALVRSWQAETQRIGPKVSILTPEPMPTAVRARFFPGEDRAPLSSEIDVASGLVAQL